MSEGFGPIVNTPGHNGVDFETRVDFDRLRAYRLARAREALEASDLGAILLFDARWRAHRVGLWLGGAPPPTLRTVARARELSRGNVGTSRRHRAQGRSLRVGRQRDGRDLGRPRRPRSTHRS